MNLTDLLPLLEDEIERTARLLLFAEYNLPPELFRQLLPPLRDARWSARLQTPVASSPQYVTVHLGGEYDRES